MENAPLALRDDPALADEDVIRRVRSGETLLFEIIMRRYNQRLFRVARAILKNDGEAEDVIQETYLRAYSNLQQFAGEAKFSTWLTRITVHECLARIRRNRLLMVGDHPHLEDRMAQIESRSNPEEELTQRQLGDVLESVIDTLPAKYRIVFALRELQELSTEETARCLQISEEAVKSRLFRARSLLRKKIDSRIGSGIRRLYQFDGQRCDRIVAAVLKRIS